MSATSNTTPTTRAPWVCPLCKRGVRGDLETCPACRGDQGGVPFDVTFPAPMWPPPPFLPTWPLPGPTTIT